MLENTGTIKTPEKILVIAECLDLSQNSTEFLERFDEGLLRTLYKPNEDFIKLVYRNMGGKRITDRTRDKIFNLINSISLNNTVDRIKVEESKDSKSGIVTTAEELKCFSIVKTIIAMSSKIKNTDLDRVGYRDYKGFFNIIVDDKARNTICYFIPIHNNIRINIRIYSRNYYIIII